MMHCVLTSIEVGCQNILLLITFPCDFSAHLNWPQINVLLRPFFSLMRKLESGEAFSDGHINLQA